MTAVLQVLQATEGGSYKVSIYTDHDNIVKLFRLLKLRGQVGQYWANGDLWEEVLRLVKAREGEVQIFKVKSHIDELPESERLAELSRTAPRIGWQHGCRWLGRSCC